MISCRCLGLYVLRRSMPNPQGPSSMLASLVEPYDSFQIAAVVPPPMSFLQGPARPHKPRLSDSQDQPQTISITSAPTPGATAGMALLDSGCHAPAAQARSLALREVNPTGGRESKPAPHRLPKYQVRSFSWVPGPQSCVLASWWARVWPG